MALSADMMEWLARVLPCTSNVTKATNYEAMRQRGVFAIRTAVYGTLNHHYAWQVKKYIQ